MFSKKYQNQIYQNKILDGNQKLTNFFGVPDSAEFSKKYKQGACPACVRAFSVSNPEPARKMGGRQAACSSGKNIKEWTQLAQPTGVIKEDGQA